MHKRTDLATHARARVLDDPNARKILLDALRSGMAFRPAAAMVGLSREAVRLYRRDNPEFSAECARVIAEFEAEQLAIVRNASMDDSKNAQWLLERRFPARWSPRMELRGPNDDEEDREADDARELSDEELLALAGGK